MNILQSALQSVGGLIPPQKLIIETYALKNIGGFAKRVLDSKIETYAHMQAITPAELRNFSDAVIDSAQAYKLYFTHKYAQILHGAKIDIKTSRVFWGDFELTLYAVRDWYNLNGWVVFYATITSEQNTTQGGADDRYLQ